MLQRRLTLERSMMCLATLPSSGSWMARLQWTTVVLVMRKFPFAGNCKQAVVCAQHPLDMNLLIALGCILRDVSYGQCIVKNSFSLLLPRQKACTPGRDKFQGCVLPSKRRSGDGSAWFLLLFCFECMRLAFKTYQLAMCVSLQ